MTTFEKQVAVEVTMLQNLIVMTQDNIDNVMAHMDYEGEACCDINELREELASYKVALAKLETPINDCADAVVDRQQDSNGGWVAPVGHWDRVGHFYAPIAYYKGAVLKYEGIVTKGNISSLFDKYPEGIVLKDYKGDRINAGTHTDYNK